MCNLSCTPHSNLEKDNSLNDSCISPSKTIVQDVIGVVKRGYFYEDIPKKKRGRAALGRTCPSNV